MNRIDHIQNKVTDYVLDLLPEGERQAVARHVAGCAECREAVRREREIGRLVHGTLHKATMPGYDRLQSLMPPIPTRRASFLAGLAPYRQWAVACLMLAALMGAFIFGGDGNYSRVGRTAETQFVTLSSGNVPGTAEAVTTLEAGSLYTIAARETGPADYSINQSPGQNNPPAEPLPVAPQATPAPAATYFQ